VERGRNYGLNVDLSGHIRETQDADVRLLLIYEPAKQNKEMKRPGQSLAVAFDFWAQRSHDVSIRS
jgi:hypothetical protein